MQSLDDLLPKEFVESRKALYELSQVKKKDDTYWKFLGELMYLGGFNAVRAVLDDYLTLEQANKLLNGARIAQNLNTYDNAIGSMAAARSVYKASEFESLMKQYKE